MFEIRKVRSPQGPVKLAREREAYFALVSQGVSSKQACLIVGVDRRTGMKWRNGRPSTKPVSRAAAPAPVRPPQFAGHRPRYLTEGERIYIADQVRAGVKQARIAAELDRSRSTISRELARNSHPGTGDYRPHAAQARARSRRPRPKTRKLAADPRLHTLVQAGLDLQHSPRQISHRLRRDFPDAPELHVCHETIYQALYLQGRGELRREIARTLRTGRTIRKPRAQPGQRRTRFTEPMIMISERPAEADDRAVPGHWEGDLIIGKDNGSAIGTLVERATRYVLLLHLPNGRTAEQVRDALIDAVSTLPAQLKRSLTWDQGAEMALHHEFRIATDLPVYFCDPRSPWQRGSNENTNGLLRQYFPKGTDLSVHTREHLDTIAVRLNGRPRETLGWDTPAERLATLLQPAT